MSNKTKLSRQKLKTNVFSRINKIRLAGLSILSYIKKNVTAFTPLGLSVKPCDKLISLSVEWLKQAENDVAVGKLDFKENGNRKRGKG